MTTPAPSDNVEPAQVGEARQAIQKILDNLSIYAALHTLCELRIFDRLARSAATADALADWAAPEPDRSRDYLLRVLRMAHAHKWTPRTPDGVFRLSDLGHRFVTTSSASAHAAVMGAALKKRCLGDVNNVRLLSGAGTHEPVWPIQVILRRLDLFEVLYLLCELRIPDRLEDGPASLHELHAWCTQATDRTNWQRGLTRDDLAKLLRIWQVQEWVGQDSSRRRYQQTIVGQILTSSSPASMRPAVMIYGLRPWWRALATMHTTVRMGRPAILAGRSSVEDLMADQPPRAAELVATLQAQHSASMAPAIADAMLAHTHDVRYLITIGGDAILLSEILLRLPDITGVLVARSYAADIAARGLAQRDELFGRWGVKSHHGARADIPLRYHPLYLIPGLIHDLSDVDACDLLARVADAMALSGPDSVLWLVASVLPAAPEPHPSLAQDLLQMTRTRHGRERTVREYAKLLHAVGLTLTTTIDMDDQTIIVAHSARDQPLPMKQQRAILRAS
ncbi:methyltransferase [Nonomuraea sp. NPDC049784]|uniref:methyltransferase n=1 Tax=Nonomuraea sp. NPDC049784 TaxID=3154361 RepID=UPI0033FBE874